MKNFWIWLSSRLPHKCKNWQMYWEDELGRGLFCATCGKTLDEESWQRQVKDSKEDAWWQAIK